MIKLARRSVSLTILALVIGLNYFPQKAEAAFNLANDSQISTQESVEKTTVVKTIDDKLVKKTAIVKKTNARSFRATAYCLKGRTASGGGVRRGIVAADPRVLPLGTKIFVNAGSYSGTYTVTDTGGVIKGNILDIWVPSCSEAIGFGRRSISVSVLGR
jgi:3D (Asp-Asp-Asp) domain-containing protein